MPTALERLREIREETAALNLLLARTHEIIIRLRCEDPPKLSRANALAYVAAQVEKMAVRSLVVGGTGDGWPDPADTFAAGDQLTGLRMEMAELEAGLYPIPLPAGCVLLPQANFDVFAAGRLYNGMAGEAVYQKPRIVKMNERLEK